MEGWAVSFRSDIRRLYRCALLMQAECISGTCAMRCCATPDLEPFGLRSRTAWDRDLFVKLRRATPETPLSVIFLDLDNFGAVNKKYGHPVGDAVLRSTFQLVRSTVGVRGDVYRCGGEEVGVLLSSIALEQAKAIAEEIRALIEREVHTQVEGLKVPQTASIGITSFVGPIENDAALAEVDGLMRAAKRNGKNRVESVPPSHSKKRRTPVGRRRAVSHYWARET